MRQTVLVLLLCLVASAQVARMTPIEQKLDSITKTLRAAKARPNPPDSVLMKADDELVKINEELKVLLRNPPSDKDRAALSALTDWALTIQSYCGTGPKGGMDVLDKKIDEKRAEYLRLKAGL